MTNEESHRAPSPSTPLDNNNNNYNKNIDDNDAMTNSMETNIDRYKTRRAAPQSVCSDPPPPRSSSGSPPSPYRKANHTNSSNNNNNNNNLHGKVHPNNNHHHHHTNNRRKSTVSGNDKILLILGLTFLAACYNILYGVRVQYNYGPKKIHIESRVPSDSAGSRPSSKTGGKLNYSRKDTGSISGNNKDGVNNVAEPSLGAKTSESEKGERAQDAASSHTDNIPAWNATFSPPNEEKVNFQPRVLQMISPYQTLKNLSTQSVNLQTIEQYPAIQSDITQQYPLYSSDDIRISNNSHSGGKGMKRRLYPDNEVEPGECVPYQPEWQSTFYPNCNAFHELELGQGLLRKSVDLVGLKGFWRHAWKVLDVDGLLGDGVSHLDLGKTDSLGKYDGRSRRLLGDIQEEKLAIPVVLKTLKYEHNYEENYYETNRIDAVAMERLTSSPHVMNIYGYCGQSALTEFATTQLKKLVDKLNRRGRLYLARDIASGMADVHNIGNAGEGNATLVHNDINPSNIMVSYGVPKFNDFNIGIMMEWNQKKSRPCRFWNHHPNAQWRAPEEQPDGHHLSKTPLSEKIDIYALGNIFFRIIVGVDPWRAYRGASGRVEDNEKMLIAELKRTTGTAPPVKESVEKSKDPAVVAIREVMYKCFRKDPEKRPSAKQIVKDLERAIKDMKRMEKEEEDKRLNTKLKN
mmetsp:Transcript_16391/g.24037  ORF Transcript_16391/g.24037 Transcript_16391/m.24037 type:complete len:688 (-) Transcript_16391:313-2376(-)